MNSPKRQITNLYRVVREKTSSHEECKTERGQKKHNIMHMGQNKKNDVNVFPFAYHPASKFVSTYQIKRQQYKKFVHLLYHGLSYSLKSLKGPTQQYLNKKAVTLFQSSNPNPLCPKNQQKRFLMLDLDETLIHSIFDINQPAQIRIQYSGSQFRFNMRPYCLQFLSNLSQHYQIYIFTASTKSYAQPIVSYLNSKKKTIQGILHRKHCLQTMNGFKIKDLRIIKNRHLKDIIMVDNLVHSFGLQLDNGIPILEFINNKNDRELINVERHLLEIRKYGDVREYISQKINIRKCTQYDQADFLNLQQQKWMERGKKVQTVVYSKIHEQHNKKKQKSSSLSSFGLKSLLICHS